MSNRRTRSAWHDEAFFGIHHDLHAGPKDTDLGSALTPEHLREFLSRVKPDWIQCDCKGHGGYTSWPSSLGTTSPGVVKDALRIYRDVTAELGIPLGVHYSGVRDNRAVQLHPDWGLVEVSGQVKAGYTCRTSPYLRQLMIPHMVEVIDKYDVDGFWVDGDNWAALPCWCERCQSEFRRRTEVEAVPKTAADAHWPAWLAFHRGLFVEYVTAYADAVHARKPQCLVCSNWMYTVRQPEPVKSPVDYLSGDYDMNWGADRAAVEGRLLDGQGKSWDLMAWGFTRIWPPNQQASWTMKTPVHLCQELAEVMALGGGVMVYTQPQRSGRIPRCHHDLLQSAAEFCLARKHVSFKTESASEVAVLHLADHYYSCNDPLFNYGNAVQPVEGALHAMLETHRSTDVLTEESAPPRLDRYKLVVVPEQSHLTASIADALRAFASDGGMVLMSGAQLSRECPDLVGAVCRGDPIDREPSPCFPGVYAAIDDTAISLLGPFQPVELMPGTEVWLHALKHQDAHRDPADHPLATYRSVGRGGVLAVHASLFRTYYLGHYPLVRRLIKQLADRLHVPWRVTVSAPPSLEVILRRRGDQLLVHLLNRGAGEMLGPNRVVVEELPPISDVSVQVRTDRTPTRISQTPDDDPIEYSILDGVVRAKIGKVRIHTVLAIE